jgi:hypothetical protein
MPKRSSKKVVAADVNVAAFNVVRAVTGAQSEKPPVAAQVREKNPAAVALGRIGGLKGGKARAEKLNATERRDIAIAAAKARWAKKEERP